MKHTKRRDLSAYEEAWSYLFFFGASLQQVLKFRRTYRNYLRICSSLLRGNFPINAILRDGSRITLNSNSAVQCIAEAQESRGFLYDMERDVLIITYPSPNKDSNAIIKFYGSMNSGEIIHIFSKELYGRLPVKGREVIDIGANIADSSIYFAVKGADRIIGIEPLPKNYEIARKNIEVNNLSDKISLILGGCAGTSKQIRINSKIQDIEHCILSNHHTDDISYEVAVSLFTLEDILEMGKIKSGAILKMDCEGCEYDSILTANENVLKRFNHILIEYHYGYRKLKHKLENSGFNVSITRPKALRRHYSDEFPNNKWMYSGYIYAENKSLYRRNVNDEISKTKY